MATSSSSLPHPFISDYAEAKRFTGEPEHTKVLLDRTAQEMRKQFRYFAPEKGASDLPLDLLKDLYKQTSTSKALIFPNSRGLAEFIAVKLRQIADRVQGHANYFSHHSSVDKEVRECVEYFAKNNQRLPFCIACTSTLALGIDIGSVDKVVQIDTAQSITSLIQRVGRNSLLAPGAGAGKPAPAPGKLRKWTSRPNASK